MARFAPFIKYLFNNFIPIILHISSLPSLPSRIIQTLAPAGSVAQNWVLDRGETAPICLKIHSVNNPFGQSLITVLPFTPLKLTLIP